MLGHSGLGVWLGKSTLRIALLMTFHLFGLTIFVGSLLVSSLSLIGSDGKAPGKIGRHLWPATMVGLTLVLVSGFLIFTGGAVEYFEAPWFRTKMVFLAAALIVQFTLYRKAIAPDTGYGTGMQRLTGVVTLLLWFSVAFAGRAIGYF
jgi:uncharacterized membrane protein SirB2